MNNGLCNRQDVINPFDGRQARKGAKELLSTNGIRMNTIAVLVVFMTLAVGVFYMIASPLSALESWLEQMKMPIWANITDVFMMFVLLMVGLFVILPMSTGCMAYVCSAARGAPMEWSGIFLPFSSVKDYGRVLLYLWGQLWRLVLSILLPIAIVEGTIVLCSYRLINLNNFEKLILFIGCGVLVAVLLAIALYCVGSSFLTPYLLWNRPDLSVGECRRLSRQKMVGQRMHVWIFHMSFMGASVLAMLSMGVLLLLYVIPLWLYSYVVLANQYLSNES